MDLNKNKRQNMIKFNRCYHGFIMQLVREEKSCSIVLQDVIELLVLVNCF